MKAYRDAASRKLVAEQAAQWLCDLREGGNETRESFYGWLRQSPRHVEEFLLTTSLWKAMDAVGPASAAEIDRAVAEARAAESANVVTLRSKPAAPDTRVSPRRWLAAASVALIVSGTAAGWLVFNSGRYSTTTGEQRTVVLDDGSIVYLNAQSRVKIRFSDDARQVELPEGEALFVIAQDAARPFYVKSGAARIQVVGTQFNVRRRDENAAKVSVVEGRVRIGAGLLGAGEEADVTREGTMIKDTTPDVAAAIAWRERRLVFRGETLEAVAAEFSRYSPRPIRVEGETARNKRLAGTFNADDPQALVLFLKQYPDLTVAQGSRGIVIRTKP